jgi:hypothetical protein
MQRPKPVETAPLQILLANLEVATARVTPHHPERIISVKLPFMTSRRPEVQEG